MNVDDGWPLGLDVIHSFLVVAEELNFRRSAERLHLDQSALSRRIQKLEQFLVSGCSNAPPGKYPLPRPDGPFTAKQEPAARYCQSIASARRIADGRPA